MKNIERIDYKAKLEEQRELLELRKTTIHTLVTLLLVSFVLIIFLYFNIVDLQDTLLIKNIQ